MSKLVRESGVLDGVKRTDGVEMRYHIFKRNGEPVIRRVPWHKDHVTGEWYSAVEGPEMSLQSLKFTINEYETGRLP